MYGPIAEQKNLGEMTMPMSVGLGFHRDGEPKNARRDDRRPLGFTGRRWKKKRRIRVPIGEEATGRRRKAMRKREPSEIRGRGIAVSSLGEPWRALIYKGRVRVPGS